MGAEIFYILCIGCTNVDFNDEDALASRTHLCQLLALGRTYVDFNDVRTNVGF